MKAMENRERRSAGQHQGAAMQKGWQTKTLGELCEIKHGFAFKSEFFSNEGQHVVLTPGNYYESGGYRDRGEKQKYYSGEIPPDYIMKEGDMLVVMTEQAAGLLGSPLIVPESDRFLHNQRLGHVIPKPGVPWCTEFFFHLFNTDTVRKAIHESASGVKVRHTSPTKIGEVTVSFPTALAEQQRIVGLLDEAFEGLATAKANAEKNLQNARALFESYLQSIFTQRGKGWVETTLSRATDGIFTGPFGSLLHKSDYVANGIPLVNPAHITEVGIEPDMRKTVSKSTALRLKSYIMSKGDIVIGRRGEMGRCALVTDVEDGWLCGTGSFFIKPSSRCDTRYLVRFLRSESCKARLEKIAGGAVMPNLSNTDLGNLAFDLPPLDRQKAIVEEIDRFHEETQRLARIYEQKIAALEALKKSLLHQAFSSQLAAGTAKTVSMSVPAPLSLTVTSFVPTLSVLPDITILDLHAAIVAMGYQHHQELGNPSYGRTKAEKCGHGVEVWVGIELGRRPMKDAAGPADADRLWEVTNHAHEKGYFSFEKPEGVARYRLTKGPAFDDLIAKAERVLGKRKAEVDQVLALMASMTRQEASLCVTVHAAWNNLLLDGETVTDERIVTEARENWHSKKMEIDRECFFKVIAWIREKELVPLGKGKKVMAKLI